MIKSLFMVKRSLHETFLKDLSPPTSLLLPLLLVPNAFETHFLMDTYILPWI